MKKILKILLFVIVVIGLIGGAVKLVKKRKAQEAAMPPAKEYAVIVKAITPKLSQTTLTIPYLALVKNENDYTLSSKFAAKILDIKAEGSSIKKGDVVVRLDTTPLQTKIAATKAQIEGAQEALASSKFILNNLYKIHARTKALLKVKGASREQYEKEANQIAQTKANIANLDAKLASLQESLKELQNELSYAVIKAKGDGTVSRRFANVGDLAMPGKPLVKIAAKKGSYLVVRVPNDQHPSHLLYKGKEYPLLELQGTFNTLKEYRTPVIEDNLVTGQRVDVNIVLFKKRGIFLPVDAILNKDGKNFIFAVQKNRAKPIEVTIVASGEDGVVVQSKERILGRRIIVAKPDILLRLLSGIAIKVQGSDNV